MGENPASRAMSNSAGLYFVKPLKAGEVVTEDAVRSVRPGFGLSPKYLAQILGRRVTQDVAFATPASWDLLESRR